MTEEDRIERVATLWERARPHLEDALAHANGTHRIADWNKSDPDWQGKLAAWLNEKLAVK